jgi:hypothetical protein
MSRTLGLVHTTLGPTVALVEAEAAGMNKDVQVNRSPVEGAFEKLMGVTRKDTTE